MHVLWTVYILFYFPDKHFKNTFHFFFSGDGNFIYSEADERHRGKVARLLSPVVDFSKSSQCMTFWYHMSGTHFGSLSIKLEYLEGFDQMLWSVGDNERPDDNWREARVLLHKSPKPYRVRADTNLLLLYGGGLLSVQGLGSRIERICLANFCLPIY